ncbi:hypothetical protein CC80DRAFT_499254 [Byssothecium circinans]|uniref:GET complex, subunit GET2 n=1 Tax=Byssothecium circinans TaxID=147558 RepID=A0A6A5UDG2_9PLEO|nr:hypothetical protein CC80DRAFT_499254 [Byssothecium circinans]
MSETPAQAKARLRREKRAAGNVDRLQAITKLQGGTHRDVSQDVPNPAQPGVAASGTATPDPEEVDISQHHYNPSPQPRLPSPFAFDGNNAPPAFGAGQTSEGQDPMMALMQQMLGGGMPGQPGQAGGGPQADLPPGLANLFSSMQGGPGAAPEPSPEQSSAWIWRLVHSLFSLALAIYIVVQTPFTGSKLARSQDPALKDDWSFEHTPPDTFAHLFYLFATFEVVLQTSRYFIEKGRLQGSGMLSSIGQLLPEPYAGYVRIVGRYSVIYSTVVSDAMVVVFVLGVASWWNGRAIA